MEKAVLNELICLVVRNNASRSAIEGLLKMGADPETMASSDICMRHAPLLTVAAHSFVATGTSTLKTLLELGVRPYRGSDITQSPYSAMVNLSRMGNQRSDDIMNRSERMVEMLAAHGLSMEDAVEDGLDLFSPMVHYWLGQFASIDPGVVYRQFGILREHLSQDSLQRLVSMESEHAVTTKLAVKKNQEKKMLLTPLAAVFASGTATQVKNALIDGFIRCGAPYDVPGYCGITHQEKPLSMVIESWKDQDGVSRSGNLIASMQSKNMVAAREIIIEAESAYVAEQASIAMVAEARSPAVPGRRM